MPGRWVGPYLLMALVVRNLPANAGDAGLIPGSGRSPGDENGNPLQYSCLGNPMDRGAWSATVQGVAKSQTHLSMHACMQTSHQTPLRLGRHPGNFLARVQPTFKFLPQWILGRGNFQNSLTNKSYPSSSPHPAL